MKTPRTDEKMFRSHRTWFLVVAGLFIAATVVIGVLYVRTEPGYPGWVGPVGPVVYAGILVVGMIIGATLTGALLAHVNLRLIQRKRMRVIDGTVDSK